MEAKLKHRHSGHHNFWGVWRFTRILLSIQSDIILRYILMIVYFIGAIVVVNGVNKELDLVVVEVIMICGIMIVGRFKI